MLGYAMLCMLCMLCYAMLQPHALMAALMCTRRAAHVQVRGVECIDAQRRRLRCEACGQKGGAAVQCAYGRCLLAWHPSCARCGWSPPRCRWPPLVGGAGYPIASCGPIL